MATPANESSQECRQWGFPIGILTSNTNEDIQALYKSLECPVCHQFPGAGPVYSCAENRHMICQKCAETVSKKCPVCSTSLSENRCFSAERCIADFLTPCKYKFEGCPYMLRGKEVREHVESCLYRPHKCIIPRCGEEVPFKQLYNHLLEVHGEKLNGVEDSNKHVIEWWIEGDISATARWPPFYFTCFDNVFLYMCVSTVHGMWEWVWILANEEEAQRFRFEAKMENLEKVLSIQFKGPVHPIRKPMKEIISSGQVFVTNSKEIRNPYIYRKGGTNKSYWRSNVQIHQISPPTITSVPYLVTNDPNKSEVNIEKSKDVWSVPLNSDQKLQTTSNPMLPKDAAKHIGQQLLKDADDPNLPNPNDVDGQIAGGQIPHNTNIRRSPNEKAGHQRVQDDFTIKLPSDKITTVIAETPTSVPKRHSKK